MANLQILLFHYALLNFLMNVSEILFRVRCKFEHIKERRYTLCISSNSKLFREADSQEYVIGLSCYLQSNVNVKAGIINNK